MLEKKILNKVAEEYNLPREKIKQIYSDWLEYIKEVISNTNFDSYNNQLGFTLPYLGKIYVNKYKLEQINKNKNGRTQIKKNSSKK